MIKTPPTYMNPGSVFTPLDQSGMNGDGAKRNLTMSEIKGEEGLSVTCFRTGGG